MRSRRLVTAALAIAAALAAVPAVAVEWSALVGAGYNRTDEWAPGLNRSVPGFDLNLGLSLDGFLYQPGVVDYGLAFDGRRLGQSQSDGPDTTRDLLAYRGRLTLFGNPRAPVTATVFANRQDDRMSSADETSRSTFRGITNLIGADVRYHELERPTLTLGYSRLETESTSALIADHRTTQSYTASTSMGGQGFAYNAAYVGLASDGLYAGDDFHDHRVDAYVAGRITDDTEARLADSYYLRTPDITSPFAPRQEFNSLQAFVTTRLKDPDTQRVSYAYAHGLQSIPGSPELERTTHSAGYVLQRTLHPEWRLGTSLDANFSESRTGDVARRDAGQSLSLAAQWSHPLSGGNMFVSVGPRFGAVEPQGGNTLWGWGAAASTNVNYHLGLADYSAGYFFTFSDDAGVEGTAIAQSAQVSAQTPVSESILRGQLTFSSQRRYGSPFGSGGTRNVDLSGAYYWRSYSLTATLSAVSGLSNAVKDPGSGDGLFLALPYDQHTITFVVAGTGQLTRAVGSTVSYRFATIDYADRPAATESEARAALFFGVGALRLTVDERYVITHSLGQTVRANVFMVSAARAFGSRY